MNPVAFLALCWSLALPLLPTQEPAATPQPGADPALLRRELLRQLDARVDAWATRAHLDLRLALDEVLPIPYLGVDADPVDGGMKIKMVYGLTGAEAAGLRPGDVLLALDQDRTDSKVALGQAIRTRAAGTRVALQVLRDGKEIELLCTLGKRPEEDEDEEEQFPDLPALSGPSTAAFLAGFESDAPGGPPAGFDVALGGHGEDPRWVVVEDAGGHVLRQDSADPTGIHFPLLLARDFDGGDAVARVRLRYAGGHVDRAGGIVLRYHDPGNYLVARVNAAEGDLRIFRVANGMRRTLPGGQILGATDDAEWHTLEFRAEGPKLTATLDGRFTVTAWDSYFLRGRGGLWTKSDSLTEFDDLSFEPLAPADDH